MPTVVDAAEMSQAVYDLQARVPVYPQGECTPDSPVWARGMNWNPILSGFTAAVYTHGNHRLLAFAGTDSLIDGLVDDVQITAGQVPSQAHEAISAARSVSGERNLYLTGHSLGGALAIIAASHTGLPAVTFNAPGVMDSCMDSARFAGGIGAFLDVVRRCVQGTRVLNIRIEGDPVSSMFTTGLQTGTTQPDYQAPACGWNPLCRHGIATCLQAVRANPRNYDALSL